LLGGSSGLAHTDAAALPAWQRERAPASYYNLGVAHGIPGVIAFLAAHTTTVPADTIKAVRTQGT
jgi:hypothetical protein